MILRPHSRAGEPGLRPVSPTYIVGSRPAQEAPTDCSLLISILTAEMQRNCVLRQERAPAESASEAARLGHVPRTVVFSVLGAQFTGEVASGTLRKLRILGVCRVW